MLPDDGAVPVPAVQQLLVPARPRVPAAAPLALPRRQGGDVDGRAHPRNTRRELPTSKNPLLNNTETEPVGSKNPAPADPIAASTPSTPEPMGTAKPAGLLVRLRRRPATLPILGMSTRETTHGGCQASETGIRSANAGRNPACCSTHDVGRSSTSTRVRVLPRQPHGQTTQHGCAVLLGRCF